MTGDDASVMTEDRGRPPATRPLWIELVVPVGTAGGAELSILELLDSVAGRIEVAATSFEDGPLTDALRERGWPVTIVPVHRGPASILRATLTLAHRADAVLANSAEVARATGRDDVAIVPPPRPAEPLPRSQARRALERLGLPATDAPVAIGVGRLVAYKGFDDLIRARALPPAAGWHAVLVGLDDPHHPGEGDPLRILAEDLGVAHRLTLLGP